MIQRSSCPAAATAGPCAASALQLRGGGAGAFIEFISITMHVRLIKIKFKLICEFANLMPGTQLDPARAMRRARPRGIMPRIQDFADRIHF